MKKLIGTFAILALLLINLTLAQSTRQAGTKKDKEASASLQTAAASTVTGRIAWRTALTANSNDIPGAMWSP